MVKVLRNIVLKVTPKPATGSNKPISLSRPSTEPVLSLSKGSGRVCTPSTCSRPWLRCALSLSKGLVLVLVGSATEARKDGGKLRQHLVALRRHRIPAGEGVELLGRAGLGRGLGLVLAATEEGQGQQPE